MLWQKDMHAVIRFFDNAIGMCALREAEVLPNQSRMVESAFVVFQDWQRKHGRTALEKPFDKEAAHPAALVREPYALSSKP